MDIEISVGIGFPHYFQLETTVRILKENSSSLSKFKTFGKNFQRKRDLSKFRLQAELETFSIVLKYCAYFQVNQTRVGSWTTCPTFCFSKCQLELLLV
jgi:hypothetical protein